MSKFHKRGSAFTPHRLNTPSLCSELKRSSQRNNSAQLRSSSAPIEDEGNDLLPLPSRFHSVKTIERITDKENTFEKSLERRQTSWYKPFIRLLQGSWSVSWRIRLQAALWISVLGFSINLALLVAGACARDGYKDGIGTITEGTTHKIAIVTTSYHILINVLSTGLLTASSFCMQLLCAPTRQDIDLAHADGSWLEIGLLSLRNFAYLPRRRAVLWLLLATSSIPLHLL